MQNAQKSGIRFGDFDYCVFTGRCYNRLIKTNKPHLKGEFIMYIYTMIIGNEYDYDCAGCTTEDVNVAYMWIKAGCKQVAILDACDLSYQGYLDIEDVYRAEHYDDEG